MTDNKIIFGMYAVTSALGFLLIFEVGGIIATSVGVILVGFAGLGLAGMARFG